MNMRRVNTVLLVVFIVATLLTGVVYLLTRQAESEQSANKNEYLYSDDKISFLFNRASGWGEAESPGDQREINFKNSEYPFASFVIFVETNSAYTLTEYVDDKYTSFTLHRENFAYLSRVDSSHKYGPSSERKFSWTKEGENMTTTWKVIELGSSMLIFEFSSLSDTHSKLWNQEILPSLAMLKIGQD